MQQDYEVTVNKVQTRWQESYASDYEARMAGAKEKNLLQAKDLDFEYWFDFKLLSAEEDLYTLQISTDGVVTWTKNYDCALDAVHAYDKVTDYGFSKRDLEAVLIEPNGKTHSKTFLTPANKARGK